MLLVLLGVLPAGLGMTGVPGAPPPLPVGPYKYTQSAQSSCLAFLMWNRFSLSGKKHLLCNFLEMTRSMKSALKNKDREYVKNGYITVSCECLLAVVLVRVLLHSQSWCLEDLSKTSLLLKPYTQNRTDTVALAVNIQCTDEWVTCNKNMRWVDKTKSGWLTCQAWLVPLMNVQEVSFHLPGSAKKKKKTLIDYQVKRKFVITLIHNWSCKEDMVYKPVVQ